MSQMPEIRIISLKDQEFRRSQIRDVFSSKGFAWNFFDAIPGAEVEPYMIHYDREKRMLFPGHDMTRNEIACFISHREVWKQCVAAGKAFLVLEDDAYVIRSGYEISSLEKLLASINFFKKDNAVVRLGHGAYRQHYKVVNDLVYDFKLVRYEQDPLCALAYIISPKVAQLLIERSEKFYLPVDDFMWNGNESHSIVYDIEPVFFSAAVENNPSTIGDRKKEKVGFLKKIKREWFRFLYRKKLRKFEKRIFSMLCGSVN